MGIIGERLKQAERLFSKNDSFGLKRLSEELSVDALIHDDELVSEASVACYALGKMMEKPYIRHHVSWLKFSKKVSLLLKKVSVEDGHETVHKLVGIIEELSQSFGRFIISIIEKGRLKAGANMYAHGASLGKAVELSHANKTELSSYIGLTRIPEKYETIPLKERLDNARRMI